MPLVLPALVLCIAAVVRIAALDERTIHIDEGMGLRASELALEGEWKFYPKNGHGPTLFYAGAVVRMIAGDDLVAARGLTVAAGVLMIGLLLFFLRRDLSVAGLATIAAGLGLSSGMTFYHAYFIHESLFLLFTACAYLAGRAWILRRNAFGFLGCAVSLVLMYATKETAVLTAFSWVVSLWCASFFAKRSTKHIAFFPSAPVLAAALLAAAALHLLLFSSFFTNPQGMLDSITAPFHWAERASVMHGKPFSYFLILLAVHEFALLAIGALLAVLVTVKRKWNAELVFLAAWFFTITLVYSLISYKTPWCIPNMILPLSLFAGVAADRTVTSLGRSGRRVLFVSLCVIFLAGSVRMARDVFVHPDRAGAHDYAYLQSGESLRIMIDIMEELSALDGRGREMPLQIIGQGDELLHVLTDRYERGYGPFRPGLPLYVNYQHAADDLASLLLGSSDVPYVRLTFTYIQHVNQIDLFVAQPLWERYRQSAAFVASPRREGEVHDYR